MAERASMMNSYSVNMLPKGSIQDEKPALREKCRKLRCLTCRECTCCIIGLFISIIFCTAGLLIFIISGSKSVPTEPLGQPSSVEFINSSIGADYIYLKWKEPSKTGGAYITSYTLQYRYNVNQNQYTNWSNVLLIDEGLGLNHNVSRLNGSTSYQFQITAHNIAGFTANWSDISLTTKSAVAPLSPSAPFALDINQLKDRDNEYDFTMAFDTASNGGSPITQYSVYYAPYNSTSYKLFCSINKAELSQLSEYQYPNCSGTITQLDLSQLFNFVVTATNVIGSSSYSSSTPCIIPSEDPSYFMCLEIGPPAAISNNSFTLDVSSYEIDLSWSQESCTEATPILQYQLQRTDFWQNTPYQNVSLPYDGLNEYMQIDGLLAGVPYNMRIRSMNKYGTSDWSYLFVTTPDAGMCGNIDDSKILRDNCKAFASQAPALWVKCKGDDECQTKDFESQWGFSPECTTCWVQLNDCAMGVCTKKCLQDFNANECQTCIMDECSPQTEICSGFPDWPITCPGE